MGRIEDFGRMAFPGLYEEPFLWDFAQEGCGDEEKENQQTLGLQIPSGAAPSDHRVPVREGCRGSTPFRPAPDRIRYLGEQSPRDHARSAGDHFRGRPQGDLRRVIAP